MHLQGSVRLALGPVLGLSVLSVAASGEDLSQRRLEATVRFLADDLLEGRGTPSRGLDLAAHYLANELRAGGWEPADRGRYLQEYALNEYTTTGAGTTVELNGVALEPSDYVLLAVATDPATISRRFDAAFVGHGIGCAERERDDYGGLDVRGKAVIALWGAPWKVDPEALYECDHLLGKVTQAGSRNASVLVYVSEEFESPPDKPASPEVGLFRDLAAQPVVHLAPVPSGRGLAFPPATLIITPGTFDRVLSSACGGTYAEWRRRLAAGKFRGTAVAATIGIRVEAQPTRGRSANVAAILRGTDPALRDEWVVISAHYDHLGRKDVPPGQDGIWNGADDNASGTAAALEVARKLGAGPAPRRSLLVLLTSGEDRGLVGSAHYSFHPLVPPDRVVAAVNLDMVGRSDGSVTAIAAVSPDLLATARSVAESSGIKVVPDPHPSWHLLYFVDSYHFARLGVPAIEIFTDMHKDYHQPSDEPDLIHYDQLARVTEAVRRLVDHYAQGAPKPIYQRPAWFTVPE